MITKGRLQPFIATLITMQVFRGVTMIFMNGKPISGLGGSAVFQFLGRGNVFGIPFPVVLFVLLFVLFSFVLGKTTFGRRVYATGSNEVSAKLSGVNIIKTKIAVYVISGCMAALSGLILLSIPRMCPTSVSTAGEYPARCGPIYCLFLHEVPWS